MVWKILLLCAIIFLVMVLSVFGAAETALMAVSKPLMHTLAQKGNKRALLVNQLFTRQERVLGGILFSNTLVNVLATSLATSLAIDLKGDAGIAYVTIIMTIVALFFAEILPKTLALRYSHQVVLRLARLLQAITWMLGPVIHLIYLFADQVLAWFGLNAQTASTELAFAELRGAIEIHAKPNEIKNERQMLRSVLDLSDVEVAQIMTHRRLVETLDSNLAETELIQAVLASSHTRIPLWRDNPDNIIGVIHVKDILRAIYTKHKWLVKDLMSPPWFIPEHTPLLAQLQAFQKRREHFSLVVDEYGVLLGIVTLEDILEEIVGNIEDEYDISVAGIKNMNDGSYLINGSVPIRDLNRELEWNLPENIATTIAGLILMESRQIPNIGQVFVFYGFRFEIKQKNKNQITLLKITPP